MRQMELTPWLRLPLKEQPDLEAPLVCVFVFPMLSTSQCHSLVASPSPQSISSVISLFPVLGKYVQRDPLFKSAVYACILCCLFLLHVVFGGGGLSPSCVSIVIHE
jgi:hypothetical protein